MILIACEESQAICKAFRERGFEAFSADIQEPSGGFPQWHILGDVLPIINGNCEFYTMDGAKHFVEKWELLVAHPPCTYLSNAGVCHLFPRPGVINEERYKKGLTAKKFFMYFYSANVERICIENPVPTKIYNLPKYTQIIQPYEYGHSVTKATCLWLKNLPLLQPTKIIDKKLCSTTKDPGNWYNKGGKNRQKARSKTFPGIAAAIAEQWGDLLKKEG